MAPIIPKDALLSFPKPVKTYHREPYPRIDPSNSTFKGHGKTLLITGGGMYSLTVTKTIDTDGSTATGIGLEISRAFASTGVSRICLIGRRPEPLAEGKKVLEKEFPGLRIDTYPASVSDTSSTRKIVEEIGQVDILVLSATAFAPQVPLAQVPLSEVEDSFATNVVGNWSLVNSVLKARKDKGRQTTILNVSSWAAYCPIPNQAVYGSSKAAFAQLMTEFSREYNPQEVRFMSFHPGAVWTDLASSNFSAEDFEGWEDVRLPGHFAVWLASPETGFLNGRFIWAEWDVDELLELKERVRKERYFLKISLVM